MRVTARHSHDGTGGYQGVLIVDDRAVAMTIAVFPTPHDACHAARVELVKLAAA